jgi:hypothetical protein
MALAMALLVFLLSGEIGEVNSQSSGGGGGKGGNDRKSVWSFFLIVLHGSTIAWNF